MIHVICPGCGRELEFADYLRGLTVVCKNCSHPIPVSASRTKTLAAGDVIQPNSAVTPPLPRPVAPERLSEARATVRRPADSAPIPNGVIERARAMMQTGMGVQQIEQRLVAQGPPRKMQRRRWTQFLAIALGNISNLWNGPTGTDACTGFYPLSLEAVPSSWPTCSLGPGQHVEPALVFCCPWLASGLPTRWVRS